MGCVRAYSDLISIRPRGGKPSLLATVAVMFSDENRLTNNMSAQSMRSVLDGVAVRLDESREISRYLIGLLVFLGLLGTFWGLLETIQAVGFVVSGIDTETADFGKLMQEFKTGWMPPIRDGNGVFFISVRTGRIIDTWFS